ncbi:hypothetical protein MRX96_022906 [Rhipicephalus microplus]
MRFPARCDDDRTVPAATARLLGDFDGAICVRDLSTWRAVCTLAGCGSRGRRCGGWYKRRTKWPSREVMWPGHARSPSDWGELLLLLEPPRIPGCTACISVDGFTALLRPRNDGASHRWADARTPPAQMLYSPVWSSSPRLLSSERGS